MNFPIYSSNLLARAAALQQTSTAFSNTVDVWGRVCWATSRLLYRAVHVRLTAAKGKQPQQRIVHIHTSENPAQLIYSKQTEQQQQQQQAKVNNGKIGNRSDGIANAPFEMDNENNYAPVCQTVRCSARVLSISVCLFGIRYGLLLYLLWHMSTHERWILQHNKPSQK